MSINYYSTSNESVKFEYDDLIWRENDLLISGDVSRLRLSLVTLCKNRICIGMCENFFFVRHLPSNIIIQLVIARTLVVPAFMMQLISIVDECVVTSNNAI